MERWLVLEFVGQVMFSMRFLIQWVASERRKRSVVPLAFWYFSLAGGSLLLLYALHRRDPVFALGQGAGLFIYAGNLYLLLGPGQPGSGRRRGRCLAF